MKIDIHAHEYPEAFLKVFLPLIDRGEVPRPDFNLRPWRIEDHLALMEEMHLDLQVLSLVMPAYVADRGALVGMVQAGNDSFSEAARRYPKRFLAFAALPLVDVEASVREVRRGVKDLGMKGVILGTNVRGEPIDGENFYPLYEEINRYKLPILIHPLDPQGPPQAYKYRLDLWIGWPMDTTYAVARLVLSGVLDRFPNIRLILSHLGGGTHYILDRIGQGGRHGRMKRPVLDYYREMFYDTAGPVSASAVLCAHHLFGAGQILLGTDYPFGPSGGKDYIKQGIACVSDLRLPKAEEEAIFSENTRKLLGL